MPDYSSHASEHLPVPTQVQSSIKELIEVNADLDGLLSKLIERLIPVLRSEPGNQNSEPEVKHTQYNTPIAVDICKQKDMIVNNIKRINKVISLLEV